MTTYLILLRAVNVSGKNLIKMADLKQQLINRGFQEVKTYIQSGNIILNSPLEALEVELAVQQIIKEAFGLEIVVYVLTKEKLKSYLEQNPYTDMANGEYNKLFIAPLHETPSDEGRSGLQNVNFPGEYFRVEEDVIFFYLSNGQSNSKLSNSFFEKKLKVNSTARNFNTMLKLMQMMEN